MLNIIIPYLIIILSSVFGSCVNVLNTSSKKRKKIKSIKIIAEFSTHIICGMVIGIILMNFTVKYTILIPVTLLGSFFGEVTLKYSILLLLYYLDKFIKIPIDLTDIKEKLDKNEKG